MKIILTIPQKTRKAVNEAGDRPPLGIAYIAAVLIKNGYTDVKLIDSSVERWSFEETIQCIKLIKPDIFGISVYTDTRFESFEMANAIKERLPNVIIVAGGPHMARESEAEDALRHIQSLDYVVRGEGELTFLDLVKTIESKGPICAVKGITYRKNEKIVSNEPRSFINLLSELPFPARHLLKIEDYQFYLDVPDKKIKVKSTTIMTSRGCPFRCAFCSTTIAWGSRWRLNSAERVIEEIDYIIKNYPSVKGLYFCDDTFTVDRNRVIAICEAIFKNKWEIYWECDTRVDSIDKELLQIMYQAGLRRLAFGVESGVQEIINKVVKKKIDLEKVKMVDAWCKDIGIKSHAMFIVGLPGETKADALKTLKFMKNLKGDTSISPLRVYPATEIEVMAKELGIIPDNYSWADKNCKQSQVFPSVYGSNPFFFDKMTFQEISDIIFRWMRIERFPVIDKIPAFLKGIKTKEDLRHAFQYLISFIKSYIK